jgi:hypothetical protein
MKAMIGPLKSMSADEITPGVYQPSMEFEVFLYEDNGTPVGTLSINVPYTAATNQNQLLPVAKNKVIEVTEQTYQRVIGTNDIKSAVLQ